MRCLFLVFLSLTGVAWAAEKPTSTAVSIAKYLETRLKNKSAEQNIFIEFIEEAKYDKALYQWYSAFPETRFANSSSGEALYAFLLFKNELRVLGLKRLFSISQPKNIAKALRGVWREEAPPELAEWMFVGVRWKTAWSEVFGPRVQVRLRLGTNENPTNVARFNSLKKLAPEASPERSLLDWRLALAYALKSENTKSKTSLLTLAKSSAGVVSQNLLYLTAGRVFYQSGQLRKAIESYKKVEKGSEYWYPAQEELAWSYLRRGEPQNTLAVTQAFMVEGLLTHIGPEGLFLRSLAQLKVCDYPGVTESIKTFKNFYKSRAINLIELRDGKHKAAIDQLLVKLGEGPIRLSDFNNVAQYLPRNVSRDESLFRYSHLLTSLQREAELSGRIYAYSLREGTGKVGFLAPLDHHRIDLEKRKEVVYQSAVGLLHRRASAELTEIKGILQKMRIVESELLQHLLMAGRLKKDLKADDKILKSSPQKKSAKYDMKFPFNGELWMDELGQYNVDVKKGCVAKAGL